MAPFTNQPSSHVFDSDELKANMDNILRFLEISRQIESFFISKRAIFADQKPELILAEEISDLKAEINKKEALLNKYYEKLNKWTAIVNDISSGKPVSTNLPPNTMIPMRMNQSMNNIPNLSQMNVQVGVNSNVNSQMMHGANPMMAQIRPQNSPIVSNTMNPQMQFNNQANANHGGLQGPLAFLERTTSNIGLLDTRR